QGPREVGHHRQPKLPVRTLRLSPFSVGVAGRREPPVEIVGGADQRQMREGLRKVAEVLRPQSQLLTVKPQVIRIAKHLLEEETRLVKIAHAGYALDVPEGAYRERPL